MVTGLLVDAQVQVQASACGICVGQSGTGTGFTPSTLDCLCIFPLMLSVLMHVSLSQQLAVSINNTLKKRLLGGGCTS